MKTVLLTFPDEVSIQGIKDLILSIQKDRHSSVTPKATVAIDMANNDQRDALRAQLVQLGVTFTDYTPPTGASVANGATVAVRNSAAADSHNATAVVSGTTLTGVNLAATVGMVDNADVVAVRNSAGADSHNGTAVVASGAVTGINLGATVAMVDNGDTVSATGSGSTATLVVAAGVVTGVTMA